MGPRPRKMGPVCHGPRPAGAAAAPESPQTGTELALVRDTSVRRSCQVVRIALFALIVVMVVAWGFLLRVTIVVHGVRLARALGCA